MKKVVFGLLSAVICAVNIAPVFAVERFWSIDNTIQSIDNNVNRSIPTQSGMSWPEWIRDLLIYIVRTVITPVILFVWVLLGIAWIYEMIGSTKEDSMKKWFNYILWGAIWIIVIISANFIVNTVINGWVFVYDDQWQLLWNTTAQMVYQKLIFPFLKLFMYIVLGILFILALIRTLGILFNAKDDNSKKAGMIITWNAIGILVIIFAKNIIEAIYGLEEKVVSRNAITLWDLWDWVLADKQLPFVYTVINYAVSFIWLLILILIILQAIQLLTNPTNEDTQKKLRKNVIYMLIGLVIIGTSYIVTNTLIVK